MKRWLAFIALIVLGIAFALRPVDPTPASNSQKSGERIELSASNLDRQQFNLAGELTERVRAKTFVQYANGSAEMNAMTLSQESWEISADVATTADQTVFNLHQNVQAQHNNGMQMLTDYLIYQSDSETGHAPNEAELIRGPSRSYGQSLRFNLATEFMEFDQHETSIFYLNRTK